MTNFNLEWRDLGNDTSKTFMDRVARFSIAKVRKSLMPMLLRKTVQEYTTQGVRKRRRGGARRQTFNPEHNIKKENAAGGNMTGNNTGNVPPTVAAFSKHQNTDSPMSTITSYSGFKNHELFEGARRHFGATKEPIIFKNMEDMISFAKKFADQDEGTAVEERNIFQKVARPANNYNHLHNIQGPQIWENRNEHGNFQLPYSTSTTHMPLLDSRQLSQTLTYDAVPFTGQQGNGTPQDRITQITETIRGPVNDMSMIDVQQTGRLQVTEVGNMIQAQTSPHREFHETFTHEHDFMSTSQNKGTHIMTNTTQAAPKIKLTLTQNIGPHYTEANKEARNNAESSYTNDRMSKKNKRNGDEEQDETDTSTKKLNTKQKKKIAENQDDDDMDWNAPYLGKRRCAEKKCYLDIETETHEGTLWNRYGPRMKCSGCHIGLLEAMKKNELAMVCRACKDEKCRYMLCLECNNNIKGGRGRNTTSRGRKP